VNIKQVTIRNVRNIKELSLELGPHVMLAGPNGAGKSTVIECVRLALFGWCNLTDGGGRGTAAMIGPHAAKAQIDVVVEQNEAESVTVSLVLQDNKKKYEYCTNDGEVITDLWAHLGVPKDVAELCMQHIGSDEYSDVLSTMFSDQLLLSEVLDRADGHSDWLEEQFTANKIPSDVNLWRAFGARCYEQRTEHNAEAKLLRQQIEQIGFVPEPCDKNGKTLHVKDLPAIQQMLDKLQEQRSQLMYEAGASDQARQEPAEDLDAIQASIAAAESEYIQIREDISGKRHQLREATDRRNKALSQHEFLLHEVERVRSLLCVMSGSSDNDPLPPDDPKQMYCPYGGACDSPSIRDSYAKQITEYRKMSGEMSAHDTESASFSHVLDALTADINELEQDELKVKSELLKLNARLERGQEQQAKRQNVRSAEAIRKQLKAVEESIERGQGIADALSNIKQQRAYEARLEEVERHIEHLNWAVDCFHKGALINALSTGSHKKQLFVRRCNNSLQSFGYQLDIKADGRKMLVWLSKAGYPLQPLRACSKGEQTLAHLAIAAAVASGLDVACPVVLDDLDGLDQVNMSLAENMVAHQFIGARASAQPYISQRCQVVSIKNGTLTEE